MAAVVAPGLLAVAGLASEGGMAYFRHAAMQSVSDDAAYSAAAALRSGASMEGARLEAAAIAAAHGYAANTPDEVTVTVNSPPSSGPNATDPPATEVLLTFEQAPPLTRIFRSSSDTIRTRSVSIIADGVQGCIMTLDPSGANLPVLQGATDVTANGCDVIATSSNAAAVRAGGSARLSAAHLNVVGGVSVNGAAQRPQVQKIPANSTPDPYANLPVPSPVCLPGANRKPSSGAVPPGVSCGGLELKNGTITLNGVSTVTDGDFTIGANASAPDSVTWNGNPDLDVTGVIYMPHAKLTLSDNIASQGSAGTRSFGSNASRKLTLAE